MKIEHPFSVAIVDDHFLLRKVLIRYFTSCGIEVMYEATNGIELIDQIKAGQRVPDTVLLDIDMPIMNGYETTRYLKQQFPDVPILAYSSSDELFRVNNIIEAGADLFMKKDDHPIVYVQALAQLYRMYCTS
jgi:DNA-binding NarL/FixJ family response regulator